MAFKIAQKPTFVARIKVETPNQKGGFDRSEFLAEFKRVSQSEVDELRKEPQKEVLEKVLVGWSELLDDDNQALDFNEDNLQVLLNIPQALLALRDGFWESVYKAKEKN
jgi:hypothetical protein